MSVIRRAVGKPGLGAHLNQRVKDEQILPSLERAFALHEELYGPVRRFVDLFSSDGYHSFWAVLRLGAASAVCIDLRERYLEQGRLMAELLGTSKVQFLQQDVYDMDLFAVDVALCAGGLYHVTEPEALLSLIARRAKMLVTQSIVTTHTDDVNYFITPAPTLSHGCRFTHGRYRQMIINSGWTIVEERFAEVGGPINEWSKGSSQFLCVRQ